MINPFREVEWNPDLSERRTFGKSLMIGFPCVALVLLVILRLKDGAWDVRIPLMVAGYGMGAGVLFLAIPHIAKPFYWVWYVIACSIGLVISNLLMCAVFYIIVTGFALVMKILGRDPLHRAVDKNAKSYWHSAEQPDDPKRYYRQY